MTDHIELRSDNAAGVAPQILEAVARANAGSALAYGGDPLTEELEGLVRSVFEHDGARVFPVTSGTAANALALTAMCPPWGAVLCHHTAHILNSEGGATSMLGGGAVLRGVDGADFRVQPHALSAALEGVRWGDPHQSQPAVLSLTSPTDMGTVYPVADVAELASIAAEHGLRTHLDGARVANALVALGCSPADLTWRAGVDALSLGCTKNGALSAEAIVVFDDAVADELVYRTKRSGHVTSKMRFQSAQIIAHLTDGLWLRLAAHANARMAELAAGLEEMGVRFLNRPDVNMAFVDVGASAAAAMAQDGMQFYGDAGSIRLVTSWQTTEGEVQRALEIVERALAAEEGRQDVSPAGLP